MAAVGRRTRIYEQIWDERFDGISNTLEVHIKELRRKLEQTAAASSTRAAAAVMCSPPRRRRPDAEHATPAVTQAALAVVLAAFALALYAAAWTYLHWQAEERLDAAADTLVASIDIEPDSVEWEPAERRLALGSGPLGAAIHWFITDPHGALVDRSRPARRATCWKSPAIRRH